ncbi:MAG: Gldg family protein [Gammaproteobacteria bacterium]
MRMFATVAGREFKNLFLSPLAWSILAILQGVLGYLFLAQVQRFLSVQEKLAAVDNAPGFTALIVPAFYADAGVVLLLATPLLTMRAISEERRNKTLVLLQAAPLSNAEIVLGKAFGVFAYLAVAVLMIAAMPLSLSMVGVPDDGVLFANSVALLLLAALFTSVGIFTSCLTRYPALAALSAMGLLLLLWLLDWSGGLAQRDNALLQYASLLHHYQNLQSGLIDSSDVLYFLFGSAAFAVLSIYRLERQRYPHSAVLRISRFTKKTGSAFTLAQRSGGTRLRLKNVAVTVLWLLLFGLLSWCGRRWHVQSDWTVYAANTLSEASLKTLASLPDTVHIDVYLNDEETLLKGQIAQLVRLYKQHKSNLELRFIDPRTQPQALRELGVEGDSAIFVYYQGRFEQMALVNEATLTNTLLHLAYDQEHWISVLTGHGERSPTGRANYDFGSFGQQLQQRKLKVYPLNLGQLSAIPDNTSLLVVAGPRSAWLEGETALVLAYIRRGGNLLWLTDPDAAVLPALSRELGIDTLPGIVVDHTGQLYAVNDPSFVLLTAYPQHPASAGLAEMTLFPQAAALQRTAPTAFKVEPLLSSSEQSWSETGLIAGSIAFEADQNETLGPLDIGLTLTRLLDNGGEQRIAVIGDGDFLSNAFLGNVGNREFGFKLINWLTHQDRFIAIPIKHAPDAQLHIDRRFSALIAYGFLIALPIALLAGGFGIWLWRKRR